MKERLKELRRRHRHSQKSLGEAVGVSQRTIFNWESGLSEPSASDLIALSDALGVTVEWLVRGPVASPSPLPASALSLSGAALATDRIEALVPEPVPAEAAP